MKKSDLNESIIGKRCVVYKPNDLKLKCQILRVQHSDLLLGYPDGNTAWWHYKNVRLLKKKQAPVYWVHKDAFVKTNESWGLWPNEEGRDEYYARVKLVKLKDEK